VENAETTRTVAAPARERAAVLTAGPPSGQPPASRAPSSPDPGNGDVSSASQRDGKVDKKSKVRRDKPGKAKDKDQPGNGKDK
jgi:hypothetical protein